MVTEKGIVKYLNIRNITLQIIYLINETKLSIVSFGISSNCLNTNIIEAVSFFFLNQFFKI